MESPLCSGLTAKIYAVLAVLFLSYDTPKAAVDQRQVSLGIGKTDGKEFWPVLGLRVSGKITSPP